MQLVILVREQQAFMLGLNNLEVAAHRKINQDGRDVTRIGAVVN